MPGRARDCLHAGYVDDLAGPARDHMSRDRLADVKDTRNVGAQQPLERVGGKVLERPPMLHAGVVDEDVDGADLRLEGVDRRAGRRMTGGVEGKLPRAGDRGSRLGELRRIAAVQDDLGSRVCKAPSECEADALRGAGHQRAAPFEIEEILSHRFLAISSRQRSFSVYVIDNKSKSRRRSSRTGEPPIDPPDRRTVKRKPR